MRDRLILQGDINFGVDFAVFTFERPRHGDDDNMDRTFVIHLAVNIIRPKMYVLLGVG